MAKLAGGRETDLLYCSISMKLQFKHQIVIDCHADDEVESVVLAHLE